MYEVEYDGAVHRARSRPRFPDVPDRRRQAHRRRPRRLAVPEEAARAAHRGGARPAQRRDLPRLHAWLPVLPGGDDHPPGARAPRRPGAHDGRRTACAAPATTRSRSRRCRAPTSPGIDGLVADLVNEQEGCGNVGLSLPSLRVDAFTVGIASEIQKVRRTGLTFAPEGGSWRIRQVINKLITEEDLYAAVDGAYSQGWRRVKLYFLIGLPTEMDEDTLGIARARARGREDRPQVHEAGELHGVGRRVRAEAAHAVPVVRPERRRRAAAQDRACCATTSAQVGRAGEVARSRGDVRRGHRVARRPPHRPGHRARVARRRHVPGVERALRARPLARRDGGRGPRPRLVRHPAPHRRRDPAVGPHRGRPAPATSSGRTGRPRWPSTGSPIAGGPRATTAGCAPTTRSSTSWRRRSPPAGGSQGTGQDLSRRCRGQPVRRVVGAASSWRRR